ncbi:surface antigen [alpha proteobacterium U9-1i]|nr:surface antigen [alpha proteobacterium U9-1i]
MLIMSPRAILLAACTAAGFTASEAEALTPLAFEASIDPSMDGASMYATLAPQSFERLPDAAYEPTAYVANARAGKQCVPFAREESGVEIFGDANTWWQQARGKYERAEAPEEESVMVLRGYATDARGHVAVVREIVSPTLIIVDHANWLNGGEITRNVPVRDVSANGDWSQVQVWHVPGQHWGSRTYNVQGFIQDLVQDVRDQVAGERQAPAAEALVG